MAWSPNPTPAYAYGPFTTQPVALSTAAYAGGGVTTNATKIYSADSAHRPAFSLISLLPVGALSAGKFVLLVSSAAGGTTLTEIDEVTTASQSGYSTTASGTLITFTRWASATPLILPEAADLYVASMIAQTTPPIAYAYGKLF
jgi:hypothetical protein